MLFVMLEEYPMESQAELYRKFQQYQRPPGVKILGHYHILGQRKIVIIAEAESEEALARVTSLWTDLVTLEIYPAMQWSDYYRIAYLEKQGQATPPENT